MKITTAFKEALQNNQTPLYLLGPQVGFHPSRLSRLIHGAEVKRPHDVRFRLLADLVGFKGEMFEEDKKSI